MCVCTCVCTYVWDRVRVSVFVVRLLYPSSLISLTPFYSPPPTSLFSPSLSLLSFHSLHPFFPRPPLFPSHPLSPPPSPCFPTLSVFSIPPPRPVFPSSQLEIQILSVSLSHPLLSPILLEGCVLFFSEYAVRYFDPDPSLYGADTTQLSPLAFNIHGEEQNDAL